ncbi:Crp/Fnr family transcriptional regulator [Rhodovulum euryhalinum]|uniref:CRP-like cAMP-binding protein n=1 Tax=Rhodovulum euryhalinum TaxID=35805 RepID=A0A4R2KQJ9_9RHOB|nr:Crp/Fnr family transcriptional regulator [Rhodovulum euryhalinum]TCO72408.1 CRP-like cAMP-binding protein [Rhodovulum euryhalinum]
MANRVSRGCLSDSQRDDVRGLLGEILHTLPAEHLRALVAIARLRDIPRGTEVLAEATSAQEIGYLLDGALGMQKCLPDGRTHIIGLLVPTDMYGRLFDGPTAYAIVALTDARVLTFSRGPFEDILRTTPEIERMFLVNVLDELDSAREWVLLMGGHKIVERLASFLLILLRRKLRSVRHRDPGVPMSVTIPIRRTDLAHYLGTTPESISRALHELNGEGVVRLKDAYEIEIADLPGLVRVSGADFLTGGAG